MKIFLATVAALYLSWTPVLAAANYTKVTNEVRSSASSGPDGNSQSSVKIYTEVNGQVLQNFEQTLPAGQATEVKFENQSDEASVQTEVKINSPEKLSGSKEILAWLEEVKNFLNHVLETISK